MSIKEKFGYSITTVHQHVRSVAGTRQLAVLKRMFVLRPCIEWPEVVELRSVVRRLDRILSAYTDDLPFSIDLVGAVRISVLRLAECKKSDMVRCAVGYAPGLLHIQDARLWLDNTRILR